MSHSHNGGSQYFNHLPLIVSLMYDSCSITDENASQGLPKIDWEQAKKMGAIDDFVNAVQTGLAPFLNNLYGDGEEMSEEMQKVAGLITDAAVKLLPHVKPRGKTRWRDNTLSCLCAQSCAARRAWKNAGCPI